MARDILDRELRERVRRNVGRVRETFIPPDRPMIAGRYGQVFDAGNLTTGSPPGEPGAPPPPGALVPTIPQGRILGVSMSVVTASREIAVTDPIPAPSIIRALTISGNLAVDTANSWRILLSEDSDTTAVADPSGQDLIEFRSEPVGAEDPGCRAHLTAGPLQLEPWKRVLTSGQRIKVKVHNVTGATVNLAVFVDLDEIIP